MAGAQSVKIKLGLLNQGDLQAGTSRPPRTTVSKGISQVGRCPAATATTILLLCAQPTQCTAAGGLFPLT
jgi:hypothetical protein